MMNHRHHPIRYDSIPFVEEEEVVVVGVEADIHDLTSLPSTLRISAVRFLLVGASVVFLTVCFALTNQVVPREDVPIRGDFQHVTQYHQMMSSRYEVDAYIEGMSKMLDGEGLEVAVDASTALTYLNHSQAYNIVTSSSSNTSHQYFNLNLGFDAQINQAYCGAATAANVLNSIERRKQELPVDALYDPYHYATQHDIFASPCAINHVLKLNRDDGRDGIWTAPVGLALGQVAGLLQCQLLDSSMVTTDVKWSVQKIHVDPNEISVEKMRSDFINALMKEDARVMINYYRKGLGQIGGGHFSPLGMYDESTDSFLIMDVAKYKYPPVFASANVIYNALSTIDHCGEWNWPEAQADLPENLKRPSNAEEWSQAKAILGCTQSYRGYIIISKKVT